MRRRHPGWGELVDDRLGLVRVQLLTLVLLLVVAGLAAVRSAPATACPPDTVADRLRSGILGPYATDSSQHGIENRDAAPPALERRAAQGVDSFAPQSHRPEHSLPARRTRLQRRVHAGPPSRGAGRNSSRAPPRAAEATLPLT